MSSGLMSLAYGCLYSIVFSWFMLPWTIFTSLLLIRMPSWRCPPGPLANWLPFVGSLPLFLYGHSYEMLTKISNKYGKIYRLTLGKTNVVVISDQALLREAFANDVVLGGRRIPPMMDRQGIIHAEDPLLNSQRVFINRVIPNLTIHEHAMHNNFVDKATTAIMTLWGELGATGGHPTDFEAALSFAIVNMFYATIVNTSFSRDDKDLELLISATHEHFRKNNVISFTNLSLRQDENKSALDRKNAFTTYMQPIVEKHRRELNKENPKDLIDAFLVEMEKPESSDNQFFTEPQLYAILGDLFDMSLETVSANIQWLLLVLLHYPADQDRIYEEFIKVVGIPATGCLVDKRPQMPYLEATVLEALRFSTVLPIGITHRAMDDTLIEGYHVPKDTMVIGLLWKMHRDPQLWRNDPSKFNLDNNFDDNGQLCRGQQLLPFSTGQRSCLGDDVAFEIISLILANLMFKFKMEAEDVKKLPCLEDARFGIIREPLPYKIKFIRRWV